MFLKDRLYFPCIFPQLTYSFDAIIFTLCSIVSGYGTHAMGELLDDCNMASFASNVSSSVTVGQITAAYDEAFDRDVAEFPNVFHPHIADGMCSEYGNHGLYLACAKGNYLKWCLLMNCTNEKTS